MRRASRGSPACVQTVCDRRRHLTTFGAASNDEFRYLCENLSDHAQGRICGVCQDGVRRGLDRPVDGRLAAVRLVAVD
ncbi:hypothetical protein [Streptomyces hokutonensis]|uniref:hypothetical protein n=1 Tax=Streptomyces hokutonensis TaxID=1306990 RepID=UPI00368D7E0C